MLWSTDVLTKGDLTQCLTFHFLHEQGIRQGQANANNIISPKLLGTSPWRKLGCMQCPKVSLGQWIKASILCRKLLKLSTDQSCDCQDSRIKKHFCTFASEQDRDNVLWQLLPPRDSREETSHHSQCHISQSCICASCTGHLRSLYEQYTTWSRNQKNLSQIFSQI